MKAQYLLVGVLACGHSATMQSSTTPQNTDPFSTTQITFAPLPQPPTLTPNLRLSSEIIEACKINLGNIEAAPKFDFDQSNVMPEDTSVLSQVARCVADGPLKGRVLRLTGRADSRGTDEYNMALGERRAFATGQYLRNLGVSPVQVHETSRGELDASGKDEAGWQRDRRVDIDLE